MTEYRKYYNKAMLPLDSSEFSAIELYFQISPYEFFHVRHDDRDGYAHHVMSLDYNKTKFLNDIVPIEHLNGKNRIDLLRVWLKWNGHCGQVLGDDEIAALISDLVPLCRRYNNIIILNDEHDMQFDDFKDFSKRQLRIRSTRHNGPEYYRPDLLPVYENRLAESLVLLDSMKRQLVECLDENRGEKVISLAHKVANIMQLVERDSRYIRELKEALEYIGS